MALGRASGNDELLTQECVLGDELFARTSQIPYQPDDDRSWLRHGPRERADATNNAGRGRVSATNDTRQDHVDLLDRLVPVKSCPEQIPQRSSGGREM
jgi:hypothetical protein